MAVRTTPFRFPRGDGRRRCYYDYAKNIRNLTEKDLAVAAKKFFRPDELVWMVIGDLKNVESGIRELEYGTIVRLHQDGNPME